MKAEDKWITILIFIFTPEESESCFIDAGSPGYKKTSIVPGKIKPLVWIIFSILSGILLGQLSYTICILHLQR